MDRAGLVVMVAGLVQIALACFALAHILRGSRRSRQQAADESAQPMAEMESYARERCPLPHCPDGWYETEDGDCAMPQLVNSRVRVPEEWQAGVSPRIAWKLHWGKADDLTRPDPRNKPDDAYSSLFGPPDTECWDVNGKKRCTHSWKVG